MAENFFCYLLLQLKLRRLETTLTSGVGRKALRRCPDMSRKRDGIVVSALSFLPPPLVRELIKELLFMVVRRICGSRSAFTTRPPPQAASPGRGVMPTAYTAHTFVYPSRRGVAAVKNKFPSRPRGECQIGGLKIKTIHQTKVDPQKLSTEESKHPQLRVPTAHPTLQYVA